MARTKQRNTYNINKPEDVIFEDRDKARDVFTKTCYFLAKNNYYAVLYYWGIGGIGKSELLSYLKSSSTKRFLIYDLRNSCNEIEILFSIRKKLADIDKGFKFPRFDVAISCYIDKIGKNYLAFEKDKNDDNKEVTSSVLDTAFNYILTENPYIKVAKVVKDVGKTAYKVLKAFLNKLGEHSNRYAQDYRNIESYYESSDSNSAKHLLDYVKDYFVLDYNESINNVKKSYPIVIGLDTYELFDVRRDENNLKIDIDWLINKDRGVLYNLDRTLWVICGRNQITDSNCFELSYTNQEYYLSRYNNTSVNNDVIANYQKFDFEKIDDLCTELNEPNFTLCYLLDNLDEEFVNNILIAKGISDINIQKQIYETSKGMPLYVWLCIDIYNKNNGNVTVDDFKGEIKDLTERFLRYFNAEERDMMIKMSLIGQWKDKEMFEMLGIEDNSKDTLKISQYKDMLKNSFIKKVDDNRFIFHDVVRSSIYNSTYNKDLDIVNRNIDSLITIYEKESAEISSDNIGFQLSRLKDLTEKTTTYSQLKRIFDIVCKTENLFRYTKEGYNSRIYQYIYNKSISFNDVSDNFEIELKYANELKDNKLFKNALDIYIHLDNNHPNKLEVIFGMIDCYIDLKEYKELFGLLKNLILVINALKNTSELNEEVYLQALRYLSTTLYYLNDYDRALEIDKIIYEKRKQLLTENHKDTLQSLRDIALDLEMTKQYDDVKDLYMQIYEKRKQLLGEDHPDTLQSLRDEAYILEKNDKNDEAYNVYRQVYEKRKQLLGEDHPITLNSLTDIAIYLSERNEIYKKYKQSYENKKKMLGNRHPDTLQSLENLQSSFTEDDEAYKIFNYIYEKQKELLGEDNLETLHTLRNIAQYLRKYKKYGEAYDIYQRILITLIESYGLDNSEIKTTLKQLKSMTREVQKNKNSIKVDEFIYEALKKKYGSNHIVTIDFLESIALGYSGIHNYKKSLELFKQVYELKESILGDKHPNTIESLMRIGTCHFLNKDYELAIKELKEAYEKHRETFGDYDRATIYVFIVLREHCDKLKSLHKLSEFDQKYILDNGHKTPNKKELDLIKKLDDEAHKYASHNELDKGIEIYQQIYEIYKKSLGEKNPYTIYTIREMGNAYYINNNLVKMLEKYQEAYEMFKKFYGEQNQYTLNSLNELGYKNFVCEKYDVSLEMHQKVYEGYIKLLGDKHPKTIKAIESIADVYRHLKNYEKALDLYKQAYEKYKKTLGENDSSTTDAFKTLVKVSLEAIDYDNLLEKIK